MVRIREVLFFDQIQSTESQFGSFLNKSRISSLQKFALLLSTAFSKSTGKDTTGIDYQRFWDEFDPNLLRLLNDIQSHDGAGILLLCEILFLCLLYKKLNNF